MSKIERVVEKAKHEEEVEQIIPSNLLLEYFQKADEILKTDFSLQKEREKSVIDDFKREYEVDALTDQIDSPARKYWSSGRPKDVPLQRPQDVP